MAFTQGSRVYVAHSTTSDTTWSAPFLVPVPDNTVTSDDIAGLLAFNGRIGVMWSDQGNDVMRFAVHADSAADATWTVENALSGPNLADDHLNLKSLTGDSQGRIFASVKTSRGDAGEPSTDPSVVVLQRTSSGVWSNGVASRVGDKLTRPQIALDTTNSRLYVLMSTESGGSVYYKSTPLGSLSFPTGKGARSSPGPARGSTTSAPRSRRSTQPRASWRSPATNTPCGTTTPSCRSDRLRRPTRLLRRCPRTCPDPRPPVRSELSWSASSDDVGVASYRVYRNGAQVGTPTGTTFTDSGLAPSTTYSYTVAAVDAAGNASAPSAPAASVTTLAGPGTPPPASGVTFVGAATARGATASTAVAAPTGATTGDLLVATVSVRGAPTIATPSGWTLVRTDTNSTTMRQAVFVKAATTSNASTWTLGSAKDNVVQVVAYRGVDLSNPVVGSAGAISTTAAITSPAVTSVSGSRVLTFAGIARTATLAPAAPLTERSEITNASAARYKVTADSADTTTGGTTVGPFTTTASGSAGGIGQTVALRPGA